MGKGKVDITGINTTTLKVLTNEEMNNLFFKLSCGDKSAKTELVNGNLKLVLSLLKKFNNRTDNMDDLFQIGCIGLIKAIDNFDLSHNVRFSTYAVPMILGEVKRYLRDNNSVRISRSIKDIAYKAIRLKDELTTKSGVEPTNAEIAKLLEVDEIDIVLALDSLKEPVSMYEPIYNDGGDTIYLFDQLSENKDEYSLDIKIALSKAMQKLKPREQYVLDERFVIGRTQMEIAKELGISQAQISRIEKNAINNIKRLIK